MRLARAATLCLLMLAAACSTRPPTTPEGGGGSTLGVYKLGGPYRINGRLYVPEYDPSYDRVGIASWYGDEFHGKPTANGELFDKDRISAAHPTLPLPSRVRVTNLENGRSIELRVNDRGPFVGDRLIDLSQAAAKELGFAEQGLARVRVQFLALDEARGTPPEPTVRLGRAEPARTDPGRTEPARPEPVRSEPGPGTLARAQPTAPPAPRATAAPERATAWSTPRRELSASGAVRLASFDPEPAAAPCSLGPHWVQVGAFTEEARWRAAVRTLAALESPRTEPVLINGRPALRVRLGPAEDRLEAQALAERARRLGFTDAVVLPAGSGQSSRC
jgi:rare lipoprotein A